MLKRFIKDIKKYFHYIVYSARADLKSEVANSYLNWVWWILEPFCFMLIYSFIFGRVFNSRELYFNAFIFIGLTVWDFFSKNMTNSVKMVKNNKAIVTKIYIPKFILALSKLAVNFFKMMISFGIVIVLMIVNRVPVSLNLFYIPLLFIELMILVYGLMCILLHFGVYVNDLSNVVRIGLKMMFYLTGVFYSIEGKLGKSYETLSYLLSVFNPIAFIMTSLRNCMLYSKGINIKIYLIWFAISVGIGCLGTVLIYKNENSYVKVI